MRLTAERPVAAHVAADTNHRRCAKAALTGHVARLTPWGPLLAGCLAGIGVTLALRIFAGQSESAAALGVGVRASFLPLTAGVAFLLHDPARQLTGALPARAWLTPAMRAGLALLVLCGSCTLQFAVAAGALAVDLRAAGQPSAGLPWLALAGELAAWCAVALALAAGLERTRWQNLAGVIAAMGAMAMVGALARAPFHLFSATIADMTRAQQQQWTLAWQLWVAAGIAAGCAAAWAVGDPWRRARVQIVRHVQPILGRAGTNGATQTDQRGRGPA